MAKQQIDIASNLNIYKTKFAPSFGKHSKTIASTIKQTMIKQTPDIVKVAKLDFPDDSLRVKEVNISNIDSDEDYLDSGRASF